MARWDRLITRGRVEDRRAFGPALGGGLGIGGIVILLLLNYLGGGDAGDVLNQLQNTPIQSQNINTEEFEGADTYEVFVSTVLGSANDMWERVFNANNLTYEEPKLVLFRGATQSRCGGAVSQVGPHYCPLDETIYLDETFFEELTTRLGAEGGDVAEAYVIAHEVAHHAQNELGIFDRAGDSQEASIKLELQADCFAGLWAYSIKDRGVFEQGEINEAIDAARSVGDDRIQQETTGRVNPEKWTHGSSAQRVQAFNVGYETGSLKSCEF
jgi:uncharacterized protein